VCANSRSVRGACLCPPAMALGLLWLATLTKSGGAAYVLTSTTAPRQDHSRAVSQSAAASNRGVPPYPAVLA